MDREEEEIKNQSLEHWVKHFSTILQISLINRTKTVVKKFYQTLFVDCCNLQFGAGKKEIESPFSFLR